MIDQFGNSIWCFSLKKVDAMKTGVKQMKKEYKKIDIDQIEVGFFFYTLVQILRVEWWAKVSLPNFTSNIKRK